MDQSASEPEPFKRCTKCGQVKALSQFYIWPHSRDGRTARCRLCIAEDVRARRAAQPDVLRAQAQRRREEAKAAVFAHYGTVCACCGATDDLVLDHVNSDGHEHRVKLYGRSQNIGGDLFYQWLIRNGFPEDPPLQALCRPCSSSKLDGQACTLHHEQDGDRRCRACGLLKPVAKFGRDARKSGGRRWRCRDCANKAARERYAANVERERARMRDWYQRNRSASQAGA